MPERLLSARESITWAAGFLLVATVLVVTGFTSSDPDSALYASLSEKLSAQPVARWIAPEWWGLWPDTGLTGYFREHPAGLFFIPAAMGRLGMPAGQSAYVFGAAAGLIALLLIGWIVMRVTSRADARAALVLLQFMPVAFIFRIRDNHEYPMLVCLLASLAGLDGVSRSWAWLPLVAFGFAAGLLVKGVFVVFVLMAAGLWILVNPTHGSRPRQIAACAIAIAVMAGVAIAYDAWYVRVTGERFWSAYWNRQLGPMTLATPLRQAWMFVEHVWFYVQRLLYHPAPWSLVLLWTMWRRPRALAKLSPGERRGLLFALAFATLCILLLGVASRFAERYAFSASYAVGTAGAIIAFRTWPRLRRAMTALEGVMPALAPVTWVALMMLRLALSPWLPRIGG